MTVMTCRSGSAGPSHGKSGGGKELERRRSGDVEGLLKVMYVVTAHLFRLSGCASNGRVRMKWG